MTRFALLCFLLLLGACSAPAIMDINDSSLKVQYRGWNSDLAIENEARRGCGTYGKNPVRISDAKVSSTKYRLFACQ